MDIIEAFRERVEAAIATHGIAPSAFSFQATRDPSFVLDLRKGKREPKLSTIQKVDAFIAKLDRQAARRKRQ